MKPCSKCSRELPLDQFHAGSTNQCRDCSKQYWKDRPKRLVYDADPPKEKPCTRCERTLPASEFPTNRYNKSGLNARCRDCCSDDHKKRIETLVVVPVAEKVCRGCNRTLKASSFTKKASNNDGRHSRCKDCMRLLKIEHLYNITAERYLEMSKNGCQMDGCGSFYRLCVDHDHTCCSGEKSCGACVRGVLCDKHNTGIAKFDDDPEALLAAIEYLNAHQPSQQVTPSPSH